jgi:glycosyltransferase involved in cell wall biosynthesis
MYKILNNIPDKSSCAYYRNLLPSIRMRDELKKSGIQLDTSISFDPNSDYDCYIFARIPNNPDVFPLIDGLRIKEKKIIWDIDDELWAIPESNSNYAYYTKQKLLWLNYYFNMSNSITCSTENLRKSIVKTWHIDPKKVFVLENLIDEDSYSYFYGNRYESDVIKILWSGSDSHEGDLEPLDKLFQRYEHDDKIRFVLFGHVADRFKALPPHKLMLIPWSNRKYYEGTLSFISAQIALIPLSDNSFNICKSAIKYYEMAMSGSVCLASAISPYSDVIEHRETGYLCSNIDDWEYICEELIENNDHRKIKFNERINILDNYSWDSDNKRRRDWFNFFRSIPDM